MADEPAPQAEETASGGDAAAPAADAQAPAPVPEVPPAKPSMLPLILTPVLCAASAFGVIHFAVKGSISSLEKQITEFTKAHGGGDEKKHKDGDGHGDDHGDDKKKEGDTEGDAPEDDDPKKPVLISDRGVVINPANSNGGVLLVKISLLRRDEKDHTFPKKVTNYAERLKEKTLEALEGKDMATLNKPGTKVRLREDLLIAYQEVLGSGTIKKVIISEWVSQP